MNRVCVAVVLAGWLLGVGAAFARAQITDDIRRATSALPYQQAIDAFVAAQMQNLAKPDFAAQQRARDALVGQVDGTGDNAPSDSFRDLYAASVNRNAAAVIAGDDIRARLNLAIAIARVAERCNNARLAEATIALLGDRSDAVVLWALHAARWQMGHALASDGGSALSDALLSLVRSRSSAYIVESVYEALAPEERRFASEGWSLIAARAVVPLHTLFAERVNQYASAVPPSPAAESRATIFLTGRSVWDVQTPEQREQTVQMIVNLMSLMSQHVATASSDDREQMAVMMSQAGSALIAVGLHMNNRALQDKMGPVRQITRFTPAADIAGRVDGVYDVAAGLFPGLKPPPTLGGR